MGFTANPDTFNAYIVFYYQMHTEDELLDDEALAKRWIQAVNAVEINVAYEGAIATWNYETNMTKANQKVCLCLLES